MTSLVNKQLVKRKAKNVFSSPIAAFAAWVIAILWTIPTFGLLVTSIRPEKDINTSGWWTFFLQPNISFENYTQVLLSSMLEGKTPMTMLTNNAKEQ